MIYRFTYDDISEDIVDQGGHETSIWPDATRFLAAQSFGEDQIDFEVSDEEFLGEGNQHTFVRGKQVEDTPPSFLWRSGEGEKVTLCGEVMESLFPGVTTIYVRFPR